MTDKQIRDGVDVSECGRFYDGSCRIAQNFYRCTSMPDCHYKKWKRKKEELEQLKFDYAELEKRHNESFEQFKQLKAENEALKKTIEYDSRYNDMQAEIDCGETIIKQLKAENDGLKEQLAEMISQSALLPKFFGLSAEEITQLATKCSQLKQTLTEIKVIAKACLPCDHNCEGMQEILDKISEVIDE